MRNFAKLLQLSALPKKRHKLIEPDLSSTTPGNEEGPRAGEGLLPTGTICHSGRPWLPPPALAPGHVLWDKPMKRRGISVAAPSLILLWCSFIWPGRSGRFSRRHLAAHRRKGNLVRKRSCQPPRQFPTLPDCDGSDEPRLTESLKPIK